MKFASWFVALAAGSECGPKVVTDGHFPAKARAAYKTYTTVDYADLFSIAYGDTFKVVSNTHAEEQYVLTMCENTAPTTAEIDAVAGALTGARENFTRKSFSIPLKNYGADTTAVVGFLDILGVHDRQIYISGSASAPCLLKALG